LVTITERKAINQWRKQARRKRGGGRVRGESVFLQRVGSGIEPTIDQVAGQEPTPELAAMVAENFQGLLDCLDSDELREIALLKLQAFTNNEIAEAIDRSLPTVERRLRLIRDTWQEA
jgi:DNA-directed RNA polymerase specialized sigma24 family protein